MLSSWLNRNSKLTKFCSEKRTYCTLCCPAVDVTIYVPSYSWHLLATLTEWSKLPEEIRRLGPKVVDLYTKALEKGTFTNNIIRCMFVGHFGVGKTTLVRQLQGLSAAGVESTDGIDVYRGKCYYNKETKEWITPGKSCCEVPVGT